MVVVLEQGVVVAAAAAAAAAAEAEAVAELQAGELRVGLLAKIS
eukprot:COSAG06_NODE_10901_length_1599_cov_1.081333_1_plen_44_part_10